MFLPPILEYFKKGKLTIMRYLKTILLLFILTSPNANAFISLEAYGSIGLGFGEFDETVSANNVLDHNITSPRLGAGGRVGFDIINFGFGAIGEMQWQHLDGRRSDQSGFLFWEKEGYDNSIRSLIYGGYLSFDLKVIRIIGEYYAKATGDVTYSDTETQNPFTKDDELTGNGFGLGIGATTGPVAITVMLRRVTYDELTSQTVTTTLPSSSLTKIIDDSLTLQLGLIF
jgi:hypothetical protein